jgi:hypothetical protein
MSCDFQFGASKILRRLIFVGQRVHCTCGCWLGTILSEGCKTVKSCTLDMFCPQKMKTNLKYLKDSVHSSVYGGGNVLFVLRARGMRWRSGWGTALQTGRSRDRFLMVSLEFFIGIILSAAVWPWGQLSLQQEWVPIVLKSGNLNSTSWNPQGLSSPVMGLFYLLFWEPHKTNKYTEWAERIPLD